MQVFVQQTVNGLMVGSVYALIALGFTLIFGILNVINLAHPEVFMVGAFFGWALMTYLELPLLAALPVAMIGAVLVGLLVERTSIKPLQKKGFHISPLISTLGASIFLQNLAVRIFGAEPQPFPMASAPALFQVGGIFISSLQITTLLTAGLLMIVLKLFIARSRLGRAIRSSAENPEVASLLGVNVDHMVMLTIAIASALGAAAGVMIGLLYNSVWAFMGINYGLKGLVVMIVGGVGSLGGAVLGGVLLGVVETLTVGYVSSLWRDAVAFGVLLLVLVVRPRGIFGEQAATRA